MTYQTTVFRQHRVEVIEVKMGRFLNDNTKPMESTLYEKLKLAHLY